MCWGAGDARVAGGPQWTQDVVQRLRRPLHEDRQAPSLGRPFTIHSSTTHTHTHTATAHVQAHAQHMHSTGKDADGACAQPRPAWQPRKPPAARPLPLQWAVNRRPQKPSAAWCGGQTDRQTNLLKLRHTADGSTEPAALPRLCNRLVTPLSVLPRS